MPEHDTRDQRDEQHRHRRGEILRHLDAQGSATSTTLAGALGESTGTTSYHLRVLAEAGVIEEVPERAHGRERWWRTFPTDHRGPEYDSLSPADRAALDNWRATQIPGEVELFNRFLREFRQHGNWAKASAGPVTSPPRIWTRCSRATSRC